ncbi:hypothetical protein [Planobispora rosea]|uniref:hypothetical protein n=1 Tax=Planobispora rosea TaxID=35762 RepID=UPI00083AD715|nr:hypothetical protein [Planobispora rosea]
MGDISDTSGLARLAAIDHENSSSRLSLRLVAAMDMYAAEGVRNYRAGKSPTLREMGFTELADLLDME